MSTVSSIENNHLPPFKYWHPSFVTYIYALSQLSIIAGLLYIAPCNEKKVVIRMKDGPLKLLDEELKPLQIFPAANQSELKFLISAFRWILLLCREIIELLLHLVNLSLQVRHLVFRRFRMTATMTKVQRTQILPQSGKKAKMSPPRRSHTCYMASHCTGPTGP